MLNWVAWNRTFSCAKLIVRDRTVFDIETVLTLNWMVWNRSDLTFNCV